MVPQLPVPHLSEGACQVWWASASAADEGHLELLDDGERRRRQRFRHDADRARMLVGVALAKTAVAGLLGTTPRGLVFDRGCLHCGQPHGKPRLAGPGADLHFSVSHSGDRVCVAVTRRAPVGVDVESLTRAPEPERLAAAALTPAEFARWLQLPPERRRSEVIRAWTRKESLLKATGHGLALPMDRIGLAAGDGDSDGDSDGYGPVLDHWTADVPRPTARLYDLHPGPGYLACVTVLSDQPCRIDERDGDDLLRRMPDGHGCAHG